MTPCRCTERVKDTFVWLYGEQGLLTGEASTAVSLPLTEFNDGERNVPLVDEAGTWIAEHRRRVSGTMHS